MWPCVTQLSIVDGCRYIVGHISGLRTVTKLAVPSRVAAKWGDDSIRCRDKVEKDIVIWR
jgi:hypothetical protein